MVYKLFLDSDVVIDFFTDRDPHVNAASELFELNNQGSVKLYLSAVSINNIYYIVRRFLGTPKTLEVIEALVEMTEKSEIAEDIIAKSCRCTLPFETIRATKLTEMFRVIMRRFEIFCLNIKSSRNLSKCLEMS